MKKRILSTCIALCSVVLGVMAQRSYTFNAAALNVDGLPESIWGITINKGAPGEDGAKALCNAIANSGWDFCGFSEDFNYHSALTGAPANSYYNFGTHGGSVSGLSNATDGLGFACLKRHTMSGGTKVAWTAHYGETSNGADGLINKGFRVYTVTFATGVAVDVYVLHMDAEDSAEDIAARKKQLKQLADYIIANHNNRPVIILGDTNCRYTRDELKTAFIDFINADSRFTIKDAWVEHMWGGAYPTYGSDAMMTHAYGDQKGEVVDKVFYINTTESNLTLKANSYLHDTSIAVSDHYPVVVNFTLTDPNGTATNSSSWLVNGGVIVEDENMLDGCQVTDGTTYFIKNVSTGLYLKSGATWGTQACEGSGGMPITVTLSDGKYRLGTLYGSMSAVEYPYMDNGENTTWTLQEVANTKYQYYLKINNNQALSSTSEGANGNGDHVVKCMTFNEDDDKQKWVLLTEERMKEEMALATESRPFDITPLLKAASFDRMDIDNGYASDNWPDLTFVHWENDAVSGHNGCAQDVSTNALTVSQVLKAMPAGTYTVSFEGFYRAQYKKKSYSISYTEGTMNVPVSFGSQSVNLKQNKNLDINGDARWAFLADDSWLTTFSVTTTSQGDMTFKIAKPEYSQSYSPQCWIAIDNFAIIYKGDGSEPENVLSVRAIVGNYINTIAQKVAKLNAKGQATYDITNVIYRYNNESLLSADGKAEIAMIDAAYEIALVAHKHGIVEEAMMSNGDVTALITNPSFETGDLSGWTVGGGNDVGVYPNSNDTYTITNNDGNYVFNSWNGDDGHGSSVKQTITGMPNGLYELKAVLASFGTADGKSHDYRMYLIGNGYHTSVAAVGGKTVGQEATLYFLVEDGAATIGAIGGNKGGGSEFVHYWPWEGCFLKADNFRLKYICDVSHGRLKLALDEAEATNLDEHGQAALNISAYQAAYDNKTLSTDGKTEAAAVRSALQTATKAQRTMNADMTWAITNPSFETGDYTGWSTTVGWDTGAKPQENGTYTTAGTDGQYMFNTWNNDDNATNSGVNAAITQTVTGIPNGTYKLTAMVASDNNNSMNLTANGKTTTIAASTNGASSGVFPSVECEVTNGTLAIEVVGVNNCWYKCDNFRLTYLGHVGTLDEGTGVTADDWYTSLTVNRNVKADVWNTFVVPFDMAIPEGWEVKALTGSELNRDNITLVFTEAETIEAGIPYMVRVEETVSQIIVENVQVSTTPVNAATGHVEFVGVYEAGNVPAGAFFISDNTFYQAADESNTIKAFRAYIQPIVANARSISYRTDDDETTDIENSTLNAQPSTVIYDLMGRRVTTMVKGIYIIDGRKVVVK